MQSQHVSSSFVGIGQPKRFGSNFDVGSVATSVSTPHSLIGATAHSALTSSVGPLLWSSATAHLGQFTLHSPVSSSGLFTSLSGVEDRTAEYILAPHSTQTLVSSNCADFVLTSSVSKTTH